jgi:hypothetical protein
MNLTQWAIEWGIPLAAVKDLERRIGLEGAPVAPDALGKSEAYVQSAVRLEAAQKGIKLFRNNVGVLEDITGRPVRYGLANDTPALNKKIKSADLIGFRPVHITPAHVGTVLAQFVSRECKAPAWSYSGTEHEVAQLNWANLVLTAGGDAGFATAVGTL